MYPILALRLLFVNLAGKKKGTFDKLVGTIGNIKDKKKKEIFSEKRRYLTERPTDIKTP